MKTLGNLRSFLRPFGFLAVCVLAFGLFIPQLGFYYDDWPTVLYTYTNDTEGLINHFSYDRPYSVWAYYIIGRFGTNPLVWHITALLLRWFIVLAMVWSIKPLWPKHSKKILYTGLIFAVYPGYTFQPLAVIFAPHLAAYLLFFISIGAMARWATGDKRSRVFAFVAIATCALQLFTLEYYVGLELIRPLYLWILFSNSQGAKANGRRVFRFWWPFALLLAAWFIWRLVLFDPRVEPYPRVIINEIRDNPVNGFRTFARMGIQDFVHSLVAVWADLVRPALFSLQTAIDRIAWFVALLAGVLIASITLAFSRDGKLTQKEEVKFVKQSLALGIGAFIFGLIPIWVIGEPVTQGGYSQRYILIGMFGLAMILVGLLCFFVSREQNRAILVALLAAVAISGHVRQTENYRQDWQVQRDFYWQLFWRAPTLEDETALISFDRLSWQMADPMTGNALNVLYSKEAASNASLWNFELNRTLTVNNIREGRNLIIHYRGLNFSTGSKDDLIFYYKPTDGCLWILTPEHVNNSYLPDENRELVAASNVTNILSQPFTRPAESIFGEEPEREWCYYFETASLAAQEQDWEHVISLYAAAEDQGLKPNYGIEWLPLLDAYLNVEEWESALDLSRRIHRMHSRNDAMVCNSWVSIALGDAGAQPYFEKVSDVARCKTITNE
ncbi:MAG: hypothetical protein ACRDFQ_04000 [Anaerolineales bacterium]